MSFSAAYRHKPAQSLYDHVALAFQRAMIKLVAALYRWLELTFNPNQPRVPAGRPDGAQWTDEDDVLEHQNLAGGERRVPEFVHDASPRTVHDVIAGHAARIHAGAAEQQGAFCEHAPEHTFHVAIAVRRLLALACGDGGIGHQEHGDLRFRLLFQQRVGETKGIVAAPGAVRRVVQDEQSLHPPAGVSAWELTS